MEEAINYLIRRTQSHRYTIHTIPRIFRDDSKLHALLADKCPQLITRNNKEYTLFDVLVATRKLINDESLYDEKNPTCIWCSEELARALGMSGLHITELRDLILLQMDLVDYDDLGLMSPPEQQDLPQRTCQEMSRTNFDVSGTFLLQRPFEMVLRTVSTFPKRGPYTYREICSALSEYILDRQHTTFDKRNIKMAFLHRDPLGPALGVNLMHRSQVSKLIQQQLIRTSQNKRQKQAIAYILGTIFVLILSYILYTL